MKQVRAIVERYCPHVQRNVPVEVHYAGDGGCTQRCLGNCEEKPVTGICYDNRSDSL